MLRNEHFSELENIYLCTLVDEIVLPVSRYIPFIFFYLQQHKRIQCLAYSYRYIPAKAGSKCLILSFVTSVGFFALLM